MGKPRIPVLSLEQLLALGIDPKTGLPVKATDSFTGNKSNIKRLLRIIDEQDAVQRYKWNNVEETLNMTSEELERMLYYKGQLAFFYFKEIDTYCILPYALSSDNGTGLDLYGRYRTITPIPFSGGSSDVNEEARRSLTAQTNFLSKKKLNCVYTKGTTLDEDTSKYCVILRDYTRQLGTDVISRSTLNDCLLDMMAECPCYQQTALIAGSGVKGIRVNDADQEDSVAQASNSMRKAALRNDPWIPIVGDVEFQELSDGSLLTVDQFMLAMQSLDNLRLSTYGISNGGLFEKKAHMLSEEQSVNNSDDALIYNDGLKIRQNFCDVVNTIWNLNISVEEAEELQEPEMAEGEESETAWDDETINNGGESNDSDL